LGPLLARLKVDWYLVLIMAMVAIASVAPVRGQVAESVDYLVRILIAAVFFLHGGRLSREAVIRGLTHWRLHAVVLAFTFIAFPLLCLGLAALPSSITPRTLAPGLIFLGCLPSTIQSSIAFTAVARGNVAAAVAAASASNLLAVIVTPLLVAITLHAQGGGVTADSVKAIVLQILVPFLAGHLLRPWIGGFLTTHAKRLSQVDRGTILLVVYSAFSGAVVEGLWRLVSAVDLAKLLVLCSVLLAVVLAGTLAAARLFRFDKADEIAIVFCGSKKSLASGVPMAGAIFQATGAGIALLPLMIFHQIQLMACAAIAQAYAKRQDSEAEPR
jgi:sodium/bile acid cotransporter 7